MQTYEWRRSAHGLDKTYLGYAPEHDSEEVLAVPGLLIERDRGTFTKVECGHRSVISAEHAERLVMRHTGMSMAEWMASEEGVA